MNSKIKNVSSFWDDNLCGKHFINAKYLSKEFFEQYRDFRYKKEHHLDKLINWQSSKGRNVLEIGLGIGADGARWAKNALTYTGIDLTMTSVKTTCMHFNFLNLKANLLRGNTEFLPFKKTKFDIIYSHGVLHHTPSIHNALVEINSVLKPDGELILMLYSKDSFNYLIRIQLYFRILFLFEFLKSKIGFQINSPWKNHLENFNKIGWNYFSWNMWYHHCTDGPDCEIANIYSKSEIKKILNKAGFIIKEMKKAHFPISRRFTPLERLFAPYLGFYQFVWAKKSKV